MSARPDPEADRWQREAFEELRAAEVTADHDDVADRVAGFHAHLAAEKALKALLIRLGVVLPRIHDLIELQRLLPPDDAAGFTVADLESLNPWTIDGRYPADVADAAPVRSPPWSRPRDGPWRPPRACHVPARTKTSNLVCLSPEVVTPPFSTRPARVPPSPG